MRDPFSGVFFPGVDSFFRQDDKAVVSENFCAYNGGFVHGG